MTNPVTRDEFETVKTLLASAARYAESANEGNDRLSARFDGFLTETQRVITTLNDSIRRTEAIAEQNAVAIARLTQASFDTQAVMRQVQSDIRGLQTENRRILERLERHLSDSHGA